MFRRLGNNVYKIFQVVYLMVSLTRIYILIKQVWSHNCEDKTSLLE